MNARLWAGVVAGLGLSAALLWAVAGWSDPTRVREALGHASSLQWLLVGVVAYLVGQVVRGARLRTLLDAEAPVSLATASNLVAFGYAANNVLPLRLGELARAGLVVHRTGLPPLQALTIGFVERLLDLVAILALLSLAALGIGLDVPLPRAPILALAIGAPLAFVALAAATLAPQLVSRLASRIGSRLGPRGHDALVRLAVQVTSGVAMLRDRRVMLRTVGLSVAVWILESALFYGVFRAAGLSLPFVTAIFVMAVTNVCVLVPSTPGHVGTFHSGCVLGLTIVGVEPAWALSIAILVHAAFFLPVTIWGLFPAIRSGAELGAIVRAGRRARAAPPLLPFDTSLGVARMSRRLDTHATPFLRSLVESLVPIERVAEADRDRVLTEVASFVAGQLASLPSSLRALLWVGLTGFRALVAIRYLRGFTRLSPARRRAVTTAWAYGRLALARSLFKPIRATAHLAFFERPELRVASPVPLLVRAVAS